MPEFIQKSFFRIKTAGFTLIELLVVVLIIGILASIALPQYQMAVDKAKVASSILPKLRALKDMQEIYYLANGAYARNFAELDMDLSSGGCTLNDDGTRWGCKWGNFYMHDGTAAAAHYKKVAFDVYWNHSSNKTLAGRIWCRAGFTEGDASKAEARKFCAHFGTLKIKQGSVDLYEFF